jgi:hypothetical protein
MSQMCGSTWRKCMPRSGSTPTLSRWYLSLSLPVSGRSVLIVCMQYENALKRMRRGVDAGVWTALAHSHLESGNAVQAMRLMLQARHLLCSPVLLLVVLTVVAACACRAAQPCTLVQPGPGHAAPCRRTSVGR